MEFCKMEGLGNDFVVFNGPLSLDREAVAALCDRRRGIGADGVLIVSPLDADRVRMEYFNADGSPAEMCGNGLRCVARRAVDTGMVSASKFIVETQVGPRRVEVYPSGDIKVELGLIATDGREVEVDGLRVRKVDVGNPHAVMFVEDPATSDVAGIGGQLERHPAFPNGTNVEFVSVRGRNLIDMRVWERGVGETLACGTGAAAVVAAAHDAGMLEPASKVRLPGGSLYVEIEGGVAWITGPARTVFSGTWNES